MHSNEKIVRLGVDPSIESSIILEANYEQGMLGRMIINASGDGCYEPVCYINARGWVDRKRALEIWEELSWIERQLLVRVL
ncbi:MAG: hypothetical protein V4469_02675 [Patescibacteria group bacterium]